MTGKCIRSKFDLFTKQREEFICSIASFTNSIRNWAYLERCGVLEIVRCMLWDPVPDIKQRAVVVVTSLANMNERVSQKIVDLDIVPGIVRRMKKQTSSCKRASMFALHAISQHSARTAFAVVKGGGLHAIMVCLQDCDPNVKISASWALNNIVQHDNHLALSAVKSGVLNCVASNLRDSYIAVKVFCALVITTLSKHSSDVAEYILHSGCFVRIAKYITHDDDKLRGLCLSAMSNICLHSVEYIETITGPQFVVDLVQFLKHDDPLVKKCSMTIIREISAHSKELTEIVIRKGGIQALLWTIQSSPSCTFRQAIITLGNIAAISECEAHKIIQRKGHFTLAVVLHSKSCEHTLMTTSWALCQIGKHSIELANHIANTGVFPRLVEIYTDPSYSQALRDVVHDAMRSLVQMCDQEGILRYFMTIAPVELLIYIVKQYSTFLMKNDYSRRSFLLADGLRKIQMIDTEPNSKIKEYVETIKLCFPEDMVKFYAPGYLESMMKKLDTFVPKIVTKQRPPLRFCGGDHAFIEKAIKEMIPNEDYNSYTE